MKPRTQLRWRTVFSRLLLAAAGTAGVLRVEPLFAEAMPHVAAAPPAQTGVAGFCASMARTGRRLRLHCQNSNAGKLMANMAKPFSKLTGGLIPECHDNEFARAMEMNATAPVGMAPGATPMPPPPPPPAVAAAAKIKQEQAQAKIRRQAVSYLAGLDCRYYPEAEVALIASLRADRDECVRLEAARAFLHCGCCTPAVVKALSISAAGTDVDGNPCEKSPRVRMTAITALQNCQCNMEYPETTLPRPELPVGERAPTDEVFQASYSDPNSDQPTASELPDDRPMPGRADNEIARLPTEGRSLLDIWKRSTR